MSYSSVYRDIKDNKITVEQAATLFSLTPAFLRGSLARLRNPEETFLVFDLILQGRITRAECVERLGISTRAVNALMARWGVASPLGVKPVERARIDMKFDIRIRAACDYIAGRISLDRAAQDAKVSDRQIRRWASDLALKHARMTFKEMASANLSERQAVAEHIMAQEELTAERVRVIDKVIAGRVDLVAHAQVTATANSKRHKEFHATAAASDLNLGVGLGPADPSRPTKPPAPAPGGRGAPQPG